jgi:hypothetical protein
MKSANPPRMAAWILQHFGPQTNNDVLAGDLSEGFQQGRSSGWYWRQVLAAVRWRRLLYALLISATMAWLMTSLFLRHTPFFLSRPIDMAIITVTYFASIFLPDMMQLRVRVLVALLIAAVFGLLCRYNPDVADRYWIFFWLVASNFAFHRKAAPSPPYPSSWRELLTGDPFAEKKRMIARLEQLIMEETDPELRKAYERAIIALHSGESTVAAIAKEIQVRSG